MDAIMTGRLIEVSIGVLIFVSCVVWATQGKPLSETSHTEDVEPANEGAHLS